MVMCTGMWWVRGHALLLLFRGIVNWLACFDVVVMSGEDGGGWGRVGGKKGMAKAPYKLQHVLFLAYEESVRDG